MVWRCQRTSKTIYHTIDPITNALSPLAIEMLADDIPQLLQSLLVGVERALYRISLDDLSFPLAKVNNNLQNNGNDKLSNNTTTTTLSNSLSENNNKIRSSSSSSSSTTTTQQQIHQPTGSKCGTENNLSNASDFNITAGAASVAAAAVTATTSSPIKRSIECTLKRSKIISGGNKHSLKRSTNNSIINNNNHNSRNDFYDSSGTNYSEMTSNAPASNCEINSMPLFCLGGEFPHIDSDEEISTDDVNRTSDAGKYNFLFLL